MPAVRAEYRTVCSSTSVEQLIFLVPEGTADALLLGVVETPEAAQAIVAAINQLLGCCHSHAPAL